MLAIAGIEDADARSHMLREEVSTAAILVADHKHINLHGLEVPNRIE